MDNTILKEIKQEKISNILQRVKDNILEKEQADLLIRFIEEAKTIEDVHNITLLGVRAKKTGFIFNSVLEKKKTNTLHFFKKNKQLSFETNKESQTHKLIIGDNYLALENLLIEYKNKIKVIYIDPPYGCDSMGEFAKTNYENSISRDNLLSMLKVRLELAKKLLSDDGIIFCSIDDKNQAYVKLLFDDIFGENNLILNMIRNIPDGNNINQVSITHEYCLCYKKSILSKLNIDFDSNDEIDTRLTKNGNSKSKILFKKGLKAIFNEEKTFEGTIGGNSEPITIIGKMKFKNGELQNDVELEAEWGIPNILLKLFNNEKVFDNKGQEYLMPYFTNSGVPHLKKIRNSGIFRSVQTYANISNELIEIFFKKVFDNPKPIMMIKDLIKIFGDQNSVILDFFAGSGTTGHAVMELNKEDGGNRKFILCQLDEDLNEALERNPNNQVIKNQIELCNDLERPLKLSEITCERLRRVMTGKTFKGESNFKWLNKNEALGGNLDVYEFEEVSDTNREEGKTPFDIIDETLYGKEIFVNKQDKIEWICKNFEITEIVLENIKKEI